MSESLFNQKLKEARRDALVSHYLATHDFSSLPEGSSVTTADDLYEYLLLDTKISNAVTTSRLAEAISSLQLFIHRSLEGYEGELAEGATKYLAKDAFLDNWDIYNKRYSTWAGKEKLRFYAGNYVEPTLRLGKTKIFTELENNINQGKLTSELLDKAMLTFVNKVENYLNMELLYAFIDEIKKTSIYIIGHINGGYFWREVLLDNSIVNEEWKPVYWGDWYPLPSKIDNDQISFKRDNRGLYLTCDAKLTSKINPEEDEQSIGNFYSWRLTPDNQWEDIGQKQKILLTHDSDYRGVFTPINGYEFYLSNYKVIDDSLLNKIQVSIDPYNESITITVIKVNQGGEEPWMILNDNTVLGIIQQGAVESTTITFSYSEYDDISIQWLDAFNRTTHTIFDVSNLPSQRLKISDGVIITEDNYQQFTLNAPESAKNIASLFSTNTAGFFNFDFQKTIATDGAWTYEAGKVGGDAFSGPYGRYFWEIFFHIPYLIATRFATEQCFEEAERWYKYIFNSAGYRDEEGKMLTVEDGQPRYWNCYPLQQDVAWDSFAAMPASTDPDVIATTDPMHYKLAIFQHTLDLLIARGDAAYRLLERDTLTEAKMYYVQAQQLLGPRPDIRVTNSWDNPTLSDEASAIQEPLTLSAEGASLTFEQWLRAGDSSEMGDGNFLPPYNDVLLAYWDKLDIRLYNLRHNLSLDGQPLSLPLFATPVDPAELHRQQSGGDGVQGDVSPAEGADIGWRYPLLAAKAQESVNRLKEFGSGLLSALEKQDSEKVTMLLQSQQSSVLGLQQEIAQKNLDGLSAELAALKSSREGLVLNQKYYTSLSNGDLSAAEIAGLALRSSSMLINGFASSTLIPAGVMKAFPNIFGMANGGGDQGAPIEAAAQSLQIAAQVLDQSAAVSEITASYQRRAADWRQQSKLLAKSIEETDNRIDSMKAQIAMQEKQIALAEMEYANQQAYLDLYNSCFTGLTLYSWMVSRLSSLYYQLYDATIPVCIQAREALKRELGNSRTDGIFSTPVWNDLYQGLLAGEGLTTELQKLENVWIQNSANGLEAMRTVSLAAVRGEESGSLSASIASVLNNGPDNSAVGKLTLKNNIFSAVLDMSTLQLADDYGPTSSDKSLFTKSIAVTLPTLLGPYQDIAATLSDDKGTVATLSHGMQDTGRFVVNLDDSRFLPFEGRDPTTMTLTLSIFNVKGAGDAAPNQRSIVENLSDIIFHIRYIMRNQQS
ncbi:Insecticidal toxin complex protein TcaB (toxin complex protein) (plasmid) [Enterobacter pasteurii]|uniref:Tc toxin subunit A-related protein n=1 Tax=Enterobacter pasteurii TaxID=3029761 RepID=UPI0011DD894E|nr:neuraminidase-like domain-containing protein [Enterobacter pasteurii]QLA70599.1 Insecticidal toxin complex protein TcaB (toxin complex protein) [Enterobacter pasteurii]